jgi:transcriptional regulator with XRE-family HTH domain
VDTLQQQFGSLIRRRRLAIGLGQEALADKATLHRTHVSLLERGKRMPSLLVVQKLAKALNTSMASLMEELERAPTDGQQAEASRSSPTKTRSPRAADASKKRPS